MDEFPFVAGVPVEGSGEMEFPCYCNARNNQPHEMGTKGCAYEVATE